MTLHALKNVVTCMVYENRVNRVMLSMPLTHLIIHHKIFEGTESCCSTRTSSGKAVVNHVIRNFLQFAGVIHSSNQSFVIFLF